MAGRFETRLAELGIILPSSAPPAANYVPWTVSGNIVFLAGQLPSKDGAFPYKGRLGDTLSLEEGYEAAKLCAINLIAHMRAAAGGDLDRVRRVLRLGGFVASTPEFTDQPKVVNGASDLIVSVFGEAGRHARTAVATPSLPLGVPVEVDAIVEIAP